MDTVYASDIKMVLLFVAGFDQWKKDNPNAKIIDIQYQATSGHFSPSSGYIASENRVLIIWK